MLFFLGDDRGFRYEAFGALVETLITIPRFTVCGWCESYAKY